MLYMPFGPLRGGGRALVYGIVTMIRIHSVMVKLKQSHVPTFKNEPGYVGVRSIS